MLKRTVIVMSIFALCVPASGSRPLTNNEVLDILQTLTASPMKTWIPAGTIQATHTEYRAPKTTDTDVINSRITRELLVAAAENATAMRVIDDPATRLSRQKIYRMQVEAMAHNVRYELANESNTQSAVTIKYDGDRFYWEINVASRSDSITTPADLVSNGYARRFDLNWNQQRVFVWDGENYIHYYRPGNHAIVTHERGNVNGPLTAGIAPWGYGLYTYANLSTLALSGIEMGSGDIELTVTDPEWQDVFLLDPTKDYALKSRTKTVGNYVTYVTYGNHTLVGGRYCPTSIVIEEYDMAGGGSTLMAAHTWSITSITDQTPAIEEFTVNYETDTLIEDYPLDASPVMYRYTPPMPPEARNINTDELLSERLAVALKDNDKYRNCASVALLFVAKRLGTSINLRDASRMLGPFDTAISLSAVQNAAEKLGIQTLAVRTDIRTLMDALNGEAEAILHLPGDDHYVVFGNIDDRFVRLIDLGSNNFFYRRPIETFEKLWGGTALLFDKHEIFSPPGLAKLDETILEDIRGSCSDCNDLVQEESFTPCAQTQNCETSTSATRKYERKQCLTVTYDASCSDSSMPYNAKSACLEGLDPNDPNSCTESGNWQVTQSGLACD